MVLWCSWLSLLSNTQAVPGSNPGGIIVLLMLCTLFLLEKVVVRFGEASENYAEFWRTTGKLWPSPTILHWNIVYRRYTQGRSVSCLLLLSLLDAGVVGKVLLEHCRT